MQEKRALRGVGSEHNLWSDRLILDVIPFVTARLRLNLFSIHLDHSLDLNWFELHLLFHSLMKPLNPRSLSITTTFCNHYQASVSSFELQISGEYGRSIGCLHNGPQLSELLLNRSVLAQRILAVNLSEIQKRHVTLGWLHLLVE